MIILKLILFIMIFVFLYLLNKKVVSGFRSGTSQGSGGGGRHGSGGGGRHGSGGGGRHRSGGGGRHRSGGGGYIANQAINKSRNYNSGGYGYSNWYPYYYVGYYIPCSINTDCPSNICLSSGICYM